MKKKTVVFSFGPPTPLNDMMATPQPDSNYYPPSERRGAMTPLQQATQFVESKQMFGTIATEVQAVERQQADRDARLAGFLDDFHRAAYNQHFVMTDASEAAAAPTPAQPAGPEPTLRSLVPLPRKIIS